MSNLSCRCALAALALIAGPGAAQALSLFVANNGVDSGTCGSSASPCRSINRAISNAVDGDHIRVGPGRYSSANEPAAACGDCLILVDKAVKIEAVEGAGGTVLDGSGFDQVVVIESDGVIFGLDHKGFTIVNGRLRGLSSLGYDDVELHSNRVIGIALGEGYVLSGGVEILATYNEAYCNRRHGFYVPAQCAGCKPLPPDGNVIRLLGNQAVGNQGRGFFVTIGTAELEGNLATGNFDPGFEAVGDGFLFKLNAATGNREEGFYVDGGSSHVYERNVAIGNDVGFFLNHGTGLTIERNAVLGNATQGIWANKTAEITKNNIFGNDPVGNCGVLNTSGAALSAIKNYWGVPGGPGPDPADDVCGDPVTFTPWLPGPTAVPFTTGAGGSP